MRSLSFLLFALLPTSTLAQHAGESLPESLAGQVLALFERADVVALGEAHGSWLDSELRLSVVRHPAFTRTVDVVVVEFANGHRQDILDRYVAGESVPRDELVRVWRDTGYETWDSRIYEAFFVAIREANAQAAPADRVRVIAGDVPVDWDNMRSGRELIEFMDRGDYPTHIVDCEILALGKKGLLVYGLGHLIHGDGQSFVTTLDAKYRGRIITLMGSMTAEHTRQLRSALSLGREVRLLSIRETAVADWPFWSAASMAGSSPLTLGQAVDRIAYYGDLADSVVPRDPSAASDSVYQMQRARRAALRDEQRRVIEREGWGGVGSYDEYSCGGGDGGSLPAPVRHRQALGMHPILLMAMRFARRRHSVTSFFLRVWHTS